LGCPPGKLNTKKMPPPPPPPPPPFSPDWPQTGTKGPSCGCDRMMGLEDPLVLFGDTNQY
jgi:hypothetical protein